MRDLSLPTVCSNVVHRAVVVAILVVGALACSDRKSLPGYELGANVKRSRVATACDTPNEGCACPTPGALVDCGEQVTRTDSYVTCTQGVRRCADDGTWGSCSGDLVQVDVSSGGTSKPMALGSPESCVKANPCDPLCRQIGDTGTGMTNLPVGLCSTQAGIVICPLCGYSGPISQLPYAEMPLEWQRVPTTCSATSDACSFDTQCVGSTCQSRTEPCASADPTCPADLTLGKPCIDRANPNQPYHIPLCNRGATALTTGTVRIGADSRSANVAACVPSSGSGDTLGFPNRGYVAIQLTADRSIEAGTCIDVNPTNSTAVGLDLAESRTLVANYDLSIAECNRCNNGSALVVGATAATSSTCAVCIGSTCTDTSKVTATLRGVLLDPAGRNPIPNALVYVPRTSVASFADGLACDTCDSLVSGSPVTWAKTISSGYFDLAGIPSETNFTLVVQLGRWRRQFTVGPIPSGQTRWVESCDNAQARVALSVDAAEPSPPADPLKRLRLPATQRRCTAATCTGEGDIPKMAVLLGEADPLQCTLRRIGIADSEFTSQAGNGRVQLFNGTGMRAPGGSDGFGGNGLLLSSGAAGSARLSDYSMLIAPCNGEHDEVDGVPYVSSPYSSGPSYNSWPDPTANDAERDAVRRFVDAGGRLIATHWMSMDFVHLNYFPPARANFSLSGGAVALVAPYDNSTDVGFSNAVASYAATKSPGFLWQYQPTNAYNLSAPVLYLYGSNVNAGSNTGDTVSAAPEGTYPPLLLDIDRDKEVGNTFYDWAVTTGASSADWGYRVRWQQWSPLVRTVRDWRGVTSLMRSNSNASWGFGPDPTATRSGLVEQSPCLQGSGDPYDCSQGATWGADLTGMYQFDTPLDAAQHCGRAGVISGHAGHYQCIAQSNARSSKYCTNLPPYSVTNPPPDCDCLTFPTDAASGCGSDMAMSPEELSFEFLLFSTSQCLGQLAPPQPLPVLVTATMYRDFASDCAENEQTVWQLFSWQSTVPTGARLDFFGATADTQAALPGDGYVQIGVANETTGTWTAANHTVAELLRQADPPQTSKRWLRVKVEFVPNATAAPTLIAWRAVFNCIANE